MEKARRWFSALLAAAMLLLIFLPVTARADGGCGCEAGDVCRCDGNCYCVMETERFPGPMNLLRLLQALTGLSGFVQYDPVTGQGIIVMYPPADKEGMEFQVQANLLTPGALRDFGVDSVWFMAGGLNGAWAIHWFAQGLIPDGTDMESAFANLLPDGGLGGDNAGSTMRGLKNAKYYVYAQGEWRDADDDAFLQYPQINGIYHLGQPDLGQISAQQGAGWTVGGGGLPFGGMGISGLGILSLPGAANTLFEGSRLGILLETPEGNRVPVFATQGQLKNLLGVTGFFLPGGIPHIARSGLDVVEMSGSIFMD